MKFFSYSFFLSTILILISGCVISNNFNSSVAAIDSIDKFKSNQEKVSKTDNLPIEYVNKSGKKFILIPKGVYIVGSPENEDGRQKKEKRHYVSLTKSFYIAEHETTQAEWNNIYDSNPSKSIGDDLPVEEVIHADAIAYIKELSHLEDFKYRLPTEAEWEVTCRAGTTSPYASSDLNQIGWYNENSENKLHPIKTKSPNAIGVYDMHGNVWEWCADNSAEYSDKHLVVDPLVRVSSGGNFVKKGGSYQTGKNICRSAYRNIYQPMIYRHKNTGFRLAFDASLLKKNNE